MLTNIVRIGNSKGIRIPARLLKECQIADQVDLEVEDGKIVIFPVSKPRKNWEASFKQMHQNGDDEFVIDEQLGLELEDWEWK